MKVIETLLKDVLLLEPAVHTDERGFFFEAYNQPVFENLVGRNIAFVQDNVSRSTRGVLRGLHFQQAPRSQAKLVRVALGEAFTVVVDLRPESDTYLQWSGIHLSDKSHRQLWIPEGMAHGFYTLSEIADYCYKTTDFYVPSAQVAIAWDDPDLNISWPLEGQPLLSSKDSCAPSLKDYLATLKK